MTEKNNHPSFTKSLFSGFFLDELVFPYPIMDKEEEENLNLIRETINKFCGNFQFTQLFRPKVVLQSFLETRRGPMKLPWL